jgi:hypothetical protein
MALVIADRVRETTTSIGITAITLAGAATGCQTFSSAIGNSNTTFYTIADQGGPNWEVGIGTYTTSGNTLSRDTVLASSNAGALVVFLTGTKDVFVTYPAERTVYSSGPLGTPSSGTLTSCSGLPISTGVSGLGTGAATFLATPSSANLASMLTDETGSGAAVFATSPTLVTPILGTPTSGNFSSGTFTWPTFNQNTTGTATNLSGTPTLPSGITLSASTLGGNLTGGDYSLTRTMYKDTGWVYYNSTTTAALDFTNGSQQRWAPTASSSPTLTITNWPPSGNLGELLIEGVNLGAAGTITWPTINWITSTGATTTTFASNGVTLQTSGTDWCLLWTRDAGTTIYGKFVR